MSAKWMNRITFWALCIVPFVAIILMSKMIGPFWFTLGLFGYISLYRPFVHINRLLQLGIIEERDAWRLFVPFHSTKYIKHLWFG
jgi:hypothetical protein